MLNILNHSTKVFEAIKNIHETISELAQYRFIKQAESCPIIPGAHGLDRSGYCYIHSGYYSLLRILYPNISSEELQMMLISKKNANYKHDENAYITSINELNKKYTTISGEKIKFRLENFMRWHTGK